MKNGTPVVKLFLTRKEFMQKKKKMFYGNNIFIELVVLSS